MRRAKPVADEEVSLEMGGRRFSWTWGGAAVPSALVPGLLTVAERDTWSGLSLLEPQYLVVSLTPKTGTMRRHVSCRRYLCVIAACFSRCGFPSGWLWIPDDTTRPMPTVASRSRRRIANDGCRKRRVRPPVILCTGRWIVATITSPRTCGNEYKRTTASEDFDGGRRKYGEK